MERLKKFVFVANIKVISSEQGFQIMSQSDIILQMNKKSL